MRNNKQSPVVFVKKPAVVATQVALAVMAQFAYAQQQVAERVAGGVSACGRDPGDPERRDEYGPMHRGDCKATLHRTKIGRARNASGQ